MIGLAERGLLPDAVIRWGIRRICRDRLRSLGPDSERRTVERMRSAPIAVATGEANDQHYEVPAAFFGAVLGDHLKYSCAHWSEDTPDLDAAEAAMLELSAARAGIRDGMRVLDLGCGWGSMSLWLASRYPACEITALSNSSSQRRFIEGRAAELGLDNLQVITEDMNEFSVDRKFDRIVSIEMFEHMRNYDRLLQRVEGWLADRGRLFVHVFCHREHAYFYEIDGDQDWMARHFFTGGLMPSRGLLHHFNRHLEVEQHWSVPGTHYEKTSNAWLERLDDRRDEVLAVFRECYGPDRADLWFRRWRLFFMACAESFGYGGGSEWEVGHYLLGRRGDA